MRTRTNLHILIGCGIASFAGSLLIPMGSARSENGCPAGYEPWRIPPENINDCMVIPDYGAPPEDPMPSEPVWDSRWGAIAVGDTSGGNGFGVSSNMTSRRAAERAAADQEITISELIRRHLVRVGRPYRDRD